MIPKAEEVSPTEVLPDDQDALNLGDVLVIEPESFEMERPLIMVVVEGLKGGATLRLPTEEREGFEAEIASEMSEDWPTFPDLEAEFPDAIGSNTLADLVKPSGGPDARLYAEDEETLALEIYHPATAPVAVEVHRLDN